MTGCFEPGVVTLRRTRSRRECFAHTVEVFRVEDLREPVVQFGYDVVFA
jgi:hypothetical protein